MRPTSSAAASPRAQTGGALRSCTRARGVRYACTSTVRAGAHARRRVGTQAGSVCDQAFVPASKQCVETTASSDPRSSPVPPMVSADTRKCPPRRPAPADEALRYACCPARPRQSAVAVVARSTGRGAGSRAALCSHSHSAGCAGTVRQGCAGRHGDSLQQRGMQRSGCLLVSKAQATASMSLTTYANRAHSASACCTTVAELSQQPHGCYEHPRVRFSGTAEYPDRTRGGARSRMHDSERRAGPLSSLGRRGLHRELRFELLQRTELVVQHAHLIRRRCMA